MKKINFLKFFSVTIISQLKTHAKICTKKMAISSEFDEKRPEIPIFLDEFFQKLWSFEQLSESETLIILVDLNRG